MTERIAAEECDGDAGRCNRGIIVEMAWDGGSGLFSDDLAFGMFCAETTDEVEASKLLVWPCNVETTA
ncbi:MAG: hypothetical protein M3237_23925 [Actinomycetota bacterium]|nr:hypothetical protein [Actinomycetota bacterium]